jgi:L-threonylcarbamoyladenylate synthase
MILKKDSENSAQIVADTLINAKVVILPTDTIYGFSGIVPVTAAEIHRIKGRDEGKPFIQLISDPADIRAYTDARINPGLLSLWPGAVTIIVRNREGGTTAFRCPGDAWLREVIGKTGKPIYSTSVNRAGEPALKTIARILEVFGQAVDLVVDDGDHEEAAPSTLVDACGDTYKIIRQGAIRIPAEFLHSV